jgi:hypothetical protein
LPANVIHLLDKKYHIYIFDKYQGTTHTLSTMLDQNIN